jgi:hypothetical protein
MRRVIAARLTGQQIAAQNDLWVQQIAALIVYTRWQHLTGRGITQSGRNPTMDRTELAPAEIIGGTVLATWLVKPDNGPERVVIMWP